MSENTPPVEGERLQKVLSAAGMGSRREIEAWIRAGRIKVNGQVAQLGDRVTGSDRIQIDGRRVHPGTRPRPRVIAYHKPEGEITTRKDPEGRPTVFERLPRVRDGRWIAIGRLDVNTSGLLLFTTDGELANRLMHPSNEVVREYAVRVLGEVAPDVIQRLKRGVELEDGQAAFEQIKAGGGGGVNQWYHVSLREGRNREVRRLWESQGVTVSRLMRVRYGPIALPRGLARGRWVDLSDAELAALYASAGLKLAAAEKRVPAAGKKKAVLRRRRKD